MRITNPQNMRGSKLITSVVVSEGGLLSGAGTDESPLVFSGVRVKSGNAIVASNVSAIAAGENVTVTPVNGVATIGVAVSQVNVASTIASDGEGPVAGSAIHAALGSKLNAPGSNGTSGQVLNTKGDGTTEWKNATVAWSNITGKTSTIAALPTTVGNAGKVLKAVNASTISWGDFDNAVTQTGTNAPANSAVWSHVSAEISSHNANGKHLPTTGTSGQVLYKTATGYEFANLPAAVTSVASATSAVNASSAISAGNAAKVNGLTVLTAVPANAKFTDTIPGSAVIKISAGGTSIGSFTVNETASKNINIPAATSTAYGVVKVVTTMANTTTDAAAISVVSAISSAMSAHMASASIHHTVDSALDGNSTNPVQNKAIVTALNGKQASLPSGTTGQYLQKTANGVQWADVATGGDYLMTDNLANAALNKAVFFLAHSSTNVPSPAEWGLCNRQYFLYSGEDATVGITDTGKLEQGHTYVHSMLGNTAFESIASANWATVRRDPDAEAKAYANPGTWYDCYYYATSGEATFLSERVRYTEAYSWADIKYNGVTERYKLTRNGATFDTNVVSASEIVLATGTVNHYGTNGYNSFELMLMALPDTSPHPPYYQQGHWTGSFWNGSGWDSVMTDPIEQYDSWISLESAIAEIGGEIVATGSQDGGYEYQSGAQYAGQVIDAMYIDITPASNSTTPTTEGVVTIDSGSSASSISVAVVNELPANPQSGVLYFVPVTAIQNLDTSDGISASIVTSLPSSPDADTLYFVTGSN